MGFLIQKVGLKRFQLDSDIQEIKGTWTLVRIPKPQIIVFSGFAWARGFTHQTETWSSVSLDTTRLSNPHSLDIKVTGKNEKRFFGKPHSRLGRKNPSRQISTGAESTDVI